MSGKGHGVDKAGLDILRQALESTSVGLAVSVAQAEHDISAGSDAYPAWRISSVNSDLLTEHKAAVHKHASDIGDHATKVSIARTTYGSIEDSVRGKITALLNPEMP
jgi:hypothetical protein